MDADETGTKWCCVSAQCTVAVYRSCVAMCCYVLLCATVCSVCRSKAVVLSHYPTLNSYSLSHLPPLALLQHTHTTHTHTHARIPTPTPTPTYIQAQKLIAEEGVTSSNWFIHTPVRRQKKKRTGEEEHG